MNVLGIDTSTLVASVALVRDGRVLAEARSEEGSRHGTVLVLVDAVCKGAAITPRELDAVAVGAGPGSFTGLRIGMATAKGIAFAAGRPLWAVSSLAALAYRELTGPLAAGGTVVAVLDARRGEVYAGAYRRAGDGIELVGAERVMPPAELAGFGDVQFVGDAYDAYPEPLAGLRGTWGQTPTGAAVAQLALLGERVDVVTGGAPAYIRPSEAETKYPDGVPGALRKR